MPLEDRLKSDGRDGKGRFAPGNPGGPGNPNAGEVSRHRAKFFAALRDDDVEKALGVIRSLMNSSKAKSGDRLAAARELLDRVIGKVIQQDLLERMERMERMLNDSENPCASNQS